MENVLGDKWRDVDMLATQAAVTLSNTLRFDKDIYRALLVVKETAEGLTKQQQKLLDDQIEEYEKGGIALDAKSQNRLKKISNRLSELSTKFVQNVTNAQDDCGIHLELSTDLDGVSNTLVDSSAKAAKAKGLEGYWVQYSEPTFTEVMSHCKVRDTRRAMYRAVKTTGLDINRPIVKEMLILRNEMALLLGYATYADYVASDRMAGTGKAAYDFLKEVENHYHPKVATEMEELQNFAKRIERDPSFELEISDIDSGLDFYYARLFRDAKHDISEEMLKEYFPIDQVLSGMFTVFGRLYGIRFEPSSKKGWHKDVQAYDLFDGDKHIATVWCDWFARKGKHGGAWMNAFYTAERANDNYDMPHMGCVVANLTPPTADKPSLLGLREVETIWHEFGHFMHFALCKTDLKEQGMMDLEYDFIEAPSQIMENWVWEPEILALIAKHYVSGKTLAKIVITKLRSSRRFRVASKAMRQLSLGLADLEVHMDPSIDIVTEGQKIKSRLYGIKTEDFDLSMLSFSHIFAGGYSAGYYSYKWAEVIEADFFEHIRENGLLFAPAGQEYREKVLARGSEVKAKELVHDFLGRESNIHAMLVRDGIV
jgi:oligopeptidase A